MENLENTKLVKRSPYITFANLSKKMSDTQKNLLLFVMMKRGKSREFSFSAKDFANTVSIVWKKKQIQNDLVKVASCSVSTFDEKFFSDRGLEGKFSVVNIFERLEYDNGKIHVKFTETAITDLLSPVDIALVSDYEVIKNLSHSGQVLYELLLLSNGDKFVMEVDALKKAYKISGTSYSYFKNFRSRYLDPAVESVGEHTHFKITKDDVHILTKGKKARAIEIRLPAVPKELSPSEKLKQFAIDLGQEVLELVNFYQEAGVDNISDEKALLEDYLFSIQGNKIDYLTRVVVNNLIDLMKEVKRTLLGRADELGESSKEILNKYLYDVKLREGFIGEIHTFHSFIESLPFYKPSDNFDNVERLKQHLMNFPGHEDEILDFMWTVIVDNEVKSFEYIFKVLDEWVKNGIKTGYQAMQYHKRNYRIKGPSRREQREALSAGIDEDFAVALTLWREDGK